MTGLNYFAISAALGATIGPRVRSPLTPTDYQQLANEMRDVRSKRAPFIPHLHRPEPVGPQYASIVKRAFAAARNGHSPDQVIADPGLNRSFLSHCEAFGIEDKPFAINKALLALRKAGELADFKTTQRKPVRGQWRYAAASELAARSMYFRHQMSVDSVLCHPDRVKEFDALAAAIIPGYSTFEYRWAALNIRKKGASVPGSWKSLPKRVAWSEPVCFSRAEEVPEGHGVYRLQEDDTVLYIGNSDDLQTSVRSQYRLAEITIFEPSLWEPDPRHLFWSFSSLPEVPSTVRYGIVNSMVAALHPVFNIPRGRGRVAA